MRFYVTKSRAADRFHGSALQRTHRTNASALGRVAIANSIMASRLDPLEFIAFLSHLSSSPANSSDVRFTSICIDLATHR